MITQSCVAIVVEVVKWWDQPDSDNIYWFEIRGKWVLVGLYGAEWDWFSLGEKQQQTQA